MKKLLILALATWGMLACSEKNTPETGTGGEQDGGSSNPKEIACDPSVLKFVFDQTSTQSITLTSSGQWSATTNVDWLIIEPLSGEGDAFVKITCKLGDPAEGKIIFSTNKASASISVVRFDDNPDGFWVSNTKQIRFSQGNLQYQPSTQTWRFAEHQYDIIGAETNSVNIVKSSYSGWLDLFTWASSGYSSNKAPYKKYNRDDFYNTESVFYPTSDIAGTKYDWGEFNAISNGGNRAGQWRTLTIEEFQYLHKKRPNAKNLTGFGRVNGVEGRIYLPHGWKTPEGLNFVAEKGNNIYTKSEWIRMEENGAIFLPRGGEYYFRPFDSNPWETAGYFDNWSYWSSSVSWIEKKAHAFSYEQGSGIFQNVYCAVRLVQDVK